MYRSFINSLKSGDIGRLYLLYGSESFLLDKALEELEKNVLTGFPEINLAIFEDDTLDIKDLINACSTLPFGSDKRLVVVKDYKGLASKFKKSSEEYIEEPKENDKSDGLKFIFEIPESTCLVFINHGDVDGRKKLFKDINKNGRVYKFDKIDKGDLVQWIRGHFLRAGKTIKISTVEYFAENIGYLDKNSETNLYHVQNEINKVLAYVGDDITVTEEHLEGLLRRSLENDIFKLIDSCWQKDISRSLKIYNDMLLSGENSFGILSMISKGIKNLMKIKELKSKGLDAKGIAKEAQIHEYTVKLYMKHIDIMSFDTLYNAFNRCIECDVNIKSGKMQERLSIELLFTTLFDE
ncbi:DNA polymerase III subunit delta [Lutispora thermophila]|uniref:DNA polymerase III subunit delta n=1 Tax=Lutispora thermophila DSM 19022 TaxID=1122184 RepID=A0A1M6DBW5_9FIRM|nr:DNA polymerase III subunit delta [Lutispora thermophila]SHI70665.1 DNA polymerase III, delta subunit [Lutispora thermophila DSM 19022]